MKCTRQACCGGIRASMFSRCVSRRASRHDFQQNIGWSMRWLWLFLFPLLLTGCSKPQTWTQQSYVFGTRVEIEIDNVSQQQAQAVGAKILARFDQLHHELHAWQPGGELYRLNTAFAHQQRVPVSPWLASILRDATIYSVRSGGSFNPAIGRLIQLWGFEADEFVPRLPAQRDIVRLVQAQPMMQDIVLENGQAYTRNALVKVDLGGYAKGYALDEAARILHEAGIHDALINIGGNIMAFGRHGDRPWRVGIQDPRKPRPLATLELKDGEAIGTSGDYQRYFELNGVRYCHIINPATGWPVQGVESVTVLIAPGQHAGVLSDVASKPLFVAGVAGWQAAAQQMGVQNAMLVDSRGKIYMTPSMQQRVHLVNQD